MKKHIGTHGHLWKRTAIIAFLLLQATSFAFNGNGFTWSYPLKEVSKDSTCRKTAWSQLSDDCKVALPIIHNANYADYKTNPLYTSIYTTLRGAPYDNGWAAGAGAHEGVDIVTSQGTPVYAVEDGVVVKARAQAGYGNVVMIKHTLAGGKLVYSIYGHLYSIAVPEGATVKEGDLIGGVGNEGYSYGNHLLWDINITPTNTYAFWGCPDYGNGYTFDVIATIVNQGLCRDYLLKNTTDPIAWIESQGGTISLSNNTALPSLTTATTEAKKKYAIVAMAPSSTPAPAVSTVTTTTNTTTSTTKATTSTTLKAMPITVPATTTTTKTTTATITATTSTQKSLSTRVITSSQISKNEVAFAPVDTTKTVSTIGTSIDVNNTSKLGEEFLKNYNVVLTPSFGNSMQVGQSSSLVLTITDKSGKPFVGMLPKEFTLIPTDALVELSPQVVRLTNSQGKAIILISAQEAGSTDLILSYNMKSVAKISVTIR